MLILREADTYVEVFSLAVEQHVYAHVSTLLVRFKAIGNIHKPMMAKAVLAPPAPYARPPILVEDLREESRGLGSSKMPTRRQSKLNDGRNAESSDV